MLAIFLMCLFTTIASAREVITSFHSDIFLKPDATMEVAETIEVKAEGNDIRHGIFREFPTHYKDRFDNNYTVAFDIQSVMRDGMDEPYHIEHKSNGVRIYIGSRDTYLKPGIYSYVIKYKTSRQIGFFEGYDELYWNVTGNGWRFPIAQASATVHLPDNIPVDRIVIGGYTGPQGSLAQDYTAKVQSDGTIFFKTTHSLSIYDGLTIVVSFPKGFVQEPSMLQKIRWFLLDNISIIVGLIGLLILLLFFQKTRRKIKKEQMLETIIPLFYPPQNISPGAIRYIQKFKYDNTALAADIVDMAVQGYLKIQYEKGWLSDSYTLTERVAPSKDVENNEILIFYRSIFDIFFKKNKSVELNEDNARLIKKVVIFSKKSYQTLAGPLHFFYTNSVIMGVLIAAISIFFVVITLASVPVLIMCGMCYAIIIIALVQLSYGYTKQGLQIKREIEGFKLFLETTETDRLKIIGTPPTKTPELYEKYLPYAIALDVEKEWSKQFAPVFEKLQQQKDGYSFIWISGGHYSSFGSSFGDSLSSGISSSISSSSSTPGSSSGSGGSGSSGGGGGGGGGGGW